MPEFKFDVPADLPIYPDYEKGIEPILTQEEQDERRLAALRKQIKIEQSSEGAYSSIPQSDSSSSRNKFDPLGLAQIKMERDEDAESEVALPYTHGQGSSDSEEALVHTESEELDEEENGEGKGNKFNDKIHKRIKQLLGANFTKIKNENSEKPEKVKSGRGKWHYACDQRYGFNVSYSNGDTIISMGQVFIIQTPKVSISSKYRGYPMPVIEPPRTAQYEDLDSRIPKFRTSEIRYSMNDNKTEYIISNRRQQGTSIDRVIDLENDGQKFDDHIDLVSESGNYIGPPLQDPDCCITKGLIFNVFTYLTKQETERQRGLSIQDGLKYEEEYLSHQLKQNAVRAMNDRQKQLRQQADLAKQQSGFQSSDNQQNNLPFGDQEKNILHRALDECKREYDSNEFMTMNDDIIRTYDENEESYISDNYQQYGLDSLKTPTSSNLAPETGGSSKKTFGFSFGGALNGKANLNHIKQEESSVVDIKSAPYLTLPHYPAPRTLTAKSCSFFVDSNYFGHNEALKRGFDIKNTLMKVFKYGTKDFFRFSNAHLIEKHDELEDTLKVLREEPQVYGNQKRKRMLKYYDRVTKLIKRIPRPSKNVETPKPVSEANIKAQMDLDKINQGLNRTEIQKFMTWCKYKYDRSIYQSQTKELIPINFEAANFYSVNHNFNMRLQINVERSKSQPPPTLTQILTQSQPTFSKEEPAKQKNVMEQKRPQIWPEDRRINVLPIRENEKPKSAQPLKKVDIEIPLYSQNKLTGSQSSSTAPSGSIQKSKVSLQGIGNVVSLPQLNSGFDQKHHYNSSLHKDSAYNSRNQNKEMSNDFPEEEQLLQDFCRSDRRLPQDQMLGGNTQENLLLLEFEQGPMKNSGLGFFSQSGTQPGGILTSQCDFTVQLSENDEESGGSGDKRNGSCMQESIEDSESACTYDILAPRQSFSQSKVLPRNSCFNRAMYI